MTKEKDKKKREYLLKERELSDLKFLLKQPQFRRYAKRFTKHCGLFEDVYRYGDRGYGTTYNSGVASVGNKMAREIIQASPEMYIQMQNEYASESKSIENESEDEKEERDILKID